MLYSGYQYGNHICKKLFGGERTIESVRNAVSEIYAEEREFRKNHPTLNWVSKLNVVFEPLRTKKSRVKELKH